MKAGKMNPLAKMPQTRNAAPKPKKMGAHEGFESTITSVASGIDSLLISARDVEERSDEGKSEDAGGDPAQHQAASDVAL